VKLDRVESIVGENGDELADSQLGPAHPSRGHRDSEPCFGARDRPVRGCDLYLTLDSNRRLPVLTGGISSRFDQSGPDPDASAGELRGRGVPQIEGRARVLKERALETLRTIRESSVTLASSSEELSATSAQLGSTSEETSAQASAAAATADAAP
jgi:hypothetical protein